MSNFTCFALWCKHGMFTFLSSNPLCVWLSVPNYICQSTITTFSMDVMISDFVPWQPPILHFIGMYHQISGLMFDYTQTSSWLWSMALPTLQPHNILPFPWMLFFQLAVHSAPQGRLSLTWEPLQISILVSLSQTADTLKGRCPYTAPYCPWSP